MTPAQHQTLEKARELQSKTTPGPWRLGADLCTICTHYGTEDDFTKGGWAKRIAQTVLPKWMDPKQGWPNGELLALAPDLAALADTLARRVEVLEGALRTIISDAETPQQFYDRNGPTWTTPSGNEYADMSSFLEKCTELADTARAALSATQPKEPRT